MGVDLHQKVGEQNQGWKIGTKNLGFYVFKKPLKTSEVQILGFPKIFFICRPIYNNNHI